MAKAKKTPEQTADEMVEKFNSETEQSGEVFYADQQLDNEAKDEQGEQLPEVKGSRQRRKAPSVEEIRVLAKLMKFEDRKTAVDGILEDLGADVTAELDAEQKAADEQQAKLDRLKKLRGE